MKAVCAALGVSRSNVAASRQPALAKPLERVGRPAKPDDDLVRDIETIIGAQPTYGYRRVWALLKRDAARAGSEPINVKRVYRAMKAHGLLLQRHAGGVAQRRHDGRIAVERSNLRWCSDGFELACDNGEKVRIAFALDCCDREAMAYVATTQGIKGDDVRDLMVASVEARFGRVNRSPQTIEWLSDNGSGYIAKETRAFARDIGLEPLTTPVTSPQSNGMAEAFVRTIKRDYARVKSSAGRSHGDRKPADLVQPLQRYSPAQRLALSFAARVHRRAITPRGRVRYLGGNNDLSSASSEGYHKEYPTKIVGHLKYAIVGLLAREYPSRHDFTGRPDRIFPSFFDRRELGRFKVFYELIAVANVEKQTHSTLQCLHLHAA